MPGTTRFVPLLLSVASVLLGSVQSNPSPQSIPSTSRAPPPLPQYYPSSSQRPPSTASSSLSPTAPLYTAQRIRPSNGYEDDEEPYPASAHLGTARTTSGAEDQPENTGFVEAIDFSSLLKDVGSSPKGPGLDIGASSSNPLFASESKDTFNGFFGSSKNPFEELTRLNTASSDHNSRQSNDDENSGFVDPNVQFRSLFDSTGTSGGFKPQDFLGSKSENIGSDPSKGSQTRAYPSFTYSGRKNVEREDDDYRGGREDGPSNRYRSSYRQVGNNNNNDYYNRDAGPGPVRQYDDDRISNSPPTDSYDDEGPSSGPSYYNNGPSGPSPRGGGGGPGPRDNRDYDRATPRYSEAAQETSHAPKTQPRAAESKNPKCKKVEKSVEYSDDYSSFTEPESDYDPSTYQGRYKRQARQGGRGKAAGGKRPMTCYVCEDEQGRYAEKCSYDSNGSPKNGEYFHSESSSFSDNGNKRRPNSGGSSSKDRTRRNPNRQRSGGDIASAESTTKSVSTKPEDAPEIAESEPKVIDKRQSGGGDFGGGGDDNDDFGGNNNDRGNNPQRDEFGDPYDSRTGRYQNPSGYEGPPLGATGGRGGGGGGGDAGFERDFNYQIPDYEREAASATREFDFSIPREFDPDVQLRGGGNNNNRGGSGGRGGGGGRASTGENPHSFLSGGRSGENPHSFLGGGRSGDSPHSFLGGGGQNRRSGGGGPHQSASNRRENLDAFDVGYSDYLRQNFPESLNSPGFSTENFPSSSNFGPSNYEYSPNYYHRPRGGGDGGGNDDRDERRQGAEISNSPSNHHNNRGYHGGRGGDRGGGGGRGGFGSGGDRGGFVPDKEHTQPSHNFAPPPGFFSEDSPAAHPHENYENLGNYMKEFSSKTRDGCHKVNKGDMTCYVCKDARGMNKEECMYASNDPKNKAMAYHEVTEYSSPTASILPAPLHATLLGLVKPSTEEDGTKEGSLAAASSNLFSLIPEESQVSSTVTPASTGKAKKTTPSNNNDKKKDVRSVKATRYAHSSTVIVHERSKRSPKEEEYDFDY
ncbi:hypothetical protein Ocin01_16511 [Orchesella cincta]|uniref:Uncharacterized protein n=1 Tax=Orchesella cincta TaxID=48709 RepID=A0A1D2MBB1_ORCCI|nr:hypothetical protein Ocin01_16511 [Orchesella cincta]